LEKHSHQHPIANPTISPSVIIDDTTFSRTDAEQTNSYKPLLAWALLIFCGVAWGLTFSLAKIIADGGGHPLGINFWQSLIGASILITLSFLTRQKFKITRHTLLFFIVCGLLGSVVPGVIYFYAASKVSPGILSITIATVPLITFGTAAALGAEKVQIGRITGVVLGIISILALVAPDESLPDPTVIPWIFAALIAAFCYSGENLIVALRAPVGLSALSMATGLFIAAAAMMAPMVVASDAFVPFNWPWGQVEWAMVGMAIVSVTAYSLYIYLIVYSGPVFASQTAYLVTISGVIWGIAIFNEQHSNWIWVSLAIMIMALALVSPRKKKIDTKA
jgi:drug/metabolite transporter (DMT)-like permease